jgi:hypothetical protein
MFRPDIIRPVLGIIVSSVCWFGRQGIWFLHLTEMRSLLMLLSIGGDQDATPHCEDNSDPLFLSETKTNTIRYTYRVTWNASPHNFRHFLIFILISFIHSNLIRLG